MGAGDGGVQAEGFEQEGVEEGEGIEGAGGGVGGEGEAFGAEEALEGGVEGELVH